MNIRKVSWALMPGILLLINSVLCSDSMKKSKLIIVGAGAAGIAAATKLVTHGVEDFIVLEAGSRIGGRVHTVPFEGNTSIDMGAQWIHGQHGNPVYEMAKEFNMTEEECPLFFNALSFNSSGTPVAREDSLHLFELIEKIMNDEEDIAKHNGSLGDYARERLASELKNHTTLKHLQSSPLFDDVLEFFEKFQNSYDGSDTWFETSAKSYDQYVTPGGCPNTVWKTGGYSNVLKLLMKEMPGQTPIDLGKKILFNKEVETIRWEDPNTVVAKCADSTEYTAEKILTTVSLGVLKSRSELFAPPLPSWKTNAIQGLSIGTVDKIFIKFPHKWWPDDNLGFNFFWTHGDEKKVLQDVGGPNGKPWVVDAFGFYLTTQDPLTFLGWVTGPSARYMETLSDEQVGIDTMKLFRHFLGANYTIPEPVRVLKSSWGTDPFIRGSYSFRSLTTDRLNTSAKDLAAPVENSRAQPVLLFAGEATHNDFYSTVHGAVASGWREADRILKIESLTGYSSCIAADVVIVGAGMAGLGAALTLLENGCTNFVLLEAQGRAGGRVQSVEIENGVYLEQGAQWIHGQDNPVYRWADQHQLTSPVRSDEAQGHYLKDDGSEVPLELVHKVAGVVGAMLEECEEFWNSQDTNYPKSIGHYLDEQFENYLKSQPPDVDLATLRQLYDWHRRFQIIDNSCHSLYSLSARAWGQYDFCGGDDYINLIRGFGSVVDVMVQRIPAALVRYKCPVKQVVWKNLALVNDQVVYDEDGVQQDLEVYDEGKQQDKDVYVQVVKYQDERNKEVNNHIVYGDDQKQREKVNREENNTEVKNISNGINHFSIQHRNSEDFDHISIANNLVSKATQFFSNEAKLVDHNLNSKELKHTSEVISNVKEKNMHISKEKSYHSKENKNNHDAKEVSHTSKESGHIIIESNHDSKEGNHIPKESKDIFKESNHDSEEVKNDSKEVNHISKERHSTFKESNHNSKENKHTCIESSNKSKQVNHISKENDPIFKGSNFPSKRTASNELQQDERKHNTSNEKAALEESIVKCVDGTCYRAKRVLVTTSLGYLKQNQDNMFVPRLPKYWSQAISSMGFASITKIFLVYAQPWWGPSDRGFQFLWTEASGRPQFDQWLREISGFDVLANQKSVLLGWVGGSYAEEVETRGEEEIGEACTRLLSHFIGRDVPRPVRVVRSTWHSNNYIRGAYSHTTSSCDELGITTRNLTLPVSTAKRNAIYFAGEALHEKYFSTTHGAFLSGSNQAKKLLQDLRSGIS